MARRFRAGEDDTRGYWIRVGAAVGLTAIAVQSIVEFSLQMPGNAALFVCTGRRRLASRAGTRIIAPGRGSRTRLIYRHTMSSRPLGVIVEFLAAFTRVMRWRAGLACALIVLAGATEGLGLLLLFPLLDALGVHGGDSTPGRLAAAVLSWLQREGHGPELATLLVLIAATTALQAGISWWQARVAYALEHEFVARERDRLSALSPAPRGRSSPRAADPTSRTSSPPNSSASVSRRINCCRLRRQRH